MNKQELYKKYGKKLMDKIFKEGYLDGCTIAIYPDGTEDIPESDIRLAIKQIKGIPISPFEWD